MKKIIGSVATTSALAVATILGTATGASAATSTNSCSADGWKGTGTVNYSNSGSNHVISSYSWTIAGQSGSTQNDIHIELRRARTAQPDQVLHSVTDTTVKNGYGYYDVSPAKSYPSSYSIWGKFRFTFDINNRPDPSCTTDTPRF